MNQVATDFLGGCPSLRAQPVWMPGDPGLSLRASGPDDALAVSVLQTTVFDGPAEARMTQELRDRGALLGEVLALENGHLIGHAVLARMEAPVGWAVLLPVALGPRAEARGLGQALVAAALDRAVATGAQAAVTTGDPMFGRRLGFRYDGPRILSTPYPERFTGVRRLGGGRTPETGTVAVVFPPEFLSA